MLPNLIHPIPVRLQRTVAAATTYDSKSREPVRQLWRRGQGPGTGDADDLVAQVHFGDGRIGKPMNEPRGTEERSDGYLLFRVVDLLAAGVATDNGDGTIDFGIERGDRIVRIGRRRCNYYVTEFKDVASYPDQGGATLLEVTFADRMPAASAREG